MLKSTNIDPKQIQMIKELKISCKNKRTLEQIKNNFDQNNS